MSGADPVGRISLSNRDFLLRTNTRDPYLAYTDGACKGNPGPGGWGAVILQKNMKTTLSGPATDTTNNRMEMTAAISAISFLPENAVVQIVTDSMYLKEGIEKWIKGWKVYGWKTKAGTAVKNAELWQRLDLESGLRNVRWSWVKGHAKNPYNEEADRLAVAAVPRAGAKNNNPNTEVMDCPVVPYHSAVVMDRLAFLANVNKAMSVKVWTDGSSRGNPGPGGWGVVMQQGAFATELKGGERMTTNNRMELQAAIEALEGLPPGCRVTLTTDSSYVKNGITSWIKGWVKNGWMTADKKPVKNQELWMRLDRATHQHNIQWEWVKGHAGHPQNERADRLAVEGSYL